MKTGPFKVLLALSAVIFIITGCSKDDPTSPKKEDPVIAGDYFPTDNTLIWRYSSNAISDGGNNFIEFEMSFGTYPYRNGSFTAMLGRLADSTKWGAIMAIKDSAGTVYAIGDNPPETPFPLFKHQYFESEVKRETITVKGKTYEALKKVLVMDSDSLTLWFTDSIGLVKEFSRQGMSLFGDENTGKNITITTELIDCRKAYLLLPLHPLDPPLMFPENRKAE